MVRRNPLAGRYSLPHCGSERAGAKANHPSQPYRCADCRNFFSVKTNSVMRASKVGYRKWAMAIYLMTTNLKGVSSMKLHRDIGVAQKTAWYMAHRIRDGWETDVETFGGPVEADETYVGGKESNKRESKKLKAGRGAVGKTVVAGVKDRPTNRIDAKVVDAVDSATLTSYVHSKIDPTALVYTDEARVYWKLRRAHESVRHSVGEYVRGMAHTNGLESFWAMFKRGCNGACHHLSVKHLHRYVQEFSSRRNRRPRDTVERMKAIVQSVSGRRLRYKDLIGPPRARRPQMLLME